MRWLVFKMVLLLAVVLAMAAFNTWAVEGPLLQANTERSMQQLRTRGTEPTTSTSVISTQRVYLIEFVVVALLAVGLFYSDVRSLVPASSSTPSGEKS